MTRSIAFILFTTTFFGFQNCSPYHNPGNAINASSSAIPAGMTLVVDNNLQTQALAILTAKCASCHDTATNGGVTQILDVYHDISTGLVVVGDPTTSHIITAIQTGGMPVGGTITAAEMTTLQGWISSMSWSGSGSPPPVTSPLPPGKTVIADAALHAQAMAIINTNCAGCHQGVSNGGIDNILDINNLQLSGMIVAGDPTQGTLLSVIAAGTMPKGTGARVTTADVATLKSWISSMTIVDQSLAPNPMPTRPALDSTFTGVNANIIQPKCIACHGPVITHDFSLNSYTSVKSRTGDILSQCQSGGMPRSPYPILTSAELSALQTWISNGALNN